MLLEKLTYQNHFRLKNTGKNTRLYPEVGCFLQQLRTDPSFIIKFNEFFTIKTSKTSNTQARAVQRIALMVDVNGVFVMIPKMI